ncbi:Teichoic acid translocation permease protein TagG [Paenibacillus plantiphilus]|uniref:Transport permease protein n=1 Tax=Paenibacillus plantiphilus TaxID=2905650 RepID=A0ABN8G2T2_9BACL|nr:ABC transporter permease [Paenibacillus plantiphilus]CAH1193355.1 Teichoic acid translocation permease protein TagG [Paenibacillus plantiphilus]
MRHAKLFVRKLLTLSHSRNLLLEFTKRDFLQRYKGSSLGIVWAIISPLLMLAVYSFIFVAVFKLKWGNDVESGDMLYTLMIFSALIPFNIFAESINRAVAVLPQSANYIKKVVMPIEILPISIVLSTAMNNMFSVGLLAIGKVLLLDTPNWTLIFAPIVFIPVILFSAGIALVVSALGVYLRDLTYITGIAVNVLFYLSPVFYSIEIIPKQFQFLLSINPIAPIIDFSRDIFIRGQMFDLSEFGLALLGASFVFVLGLGLFYFLKKGFADVI